MRLGMYMRRAPTSVGLGNAWGPHLALWTTLGLALALSHTHTHNLSYSQGCCETEIESVSRESFISTVVTEPGCFFSALPNDVVLQLIPLMHFPGWKSVLG